MTTKKWQDILKNAITEEKRGCVEQQPKRQDLKTTVVLAHIGDVIRLFFRVNRPANLLPPN